METALLAIHASNPRIYVTARSREGDHTVSTDALGLASSSFGWLAMTESDEDGYSLGLPTKAIHYCGHTWRPPVWSENRSAKLAQTQLGHFASQVASQHLIAPVQRMSGTPPRAANKDVSKTAVGIVSAECQPGSLVGCY